MKDVREIGFNDAVEVDGRTILVQTEVGGGLVARSTVLDRGAVALSESHPIPVNVLPEEVEARVREQHDRIVARVRDGEL